MLKAFCLKKIEPSVSIKRFTTVMMIFLCLFWAQSASAMWRLTSEATVYDYPQLSANAIAQAQTGQEYEIIDSTEKNRWIKVSYNDAQTGENVQGWIKEDILSSPPYSIEPSEQQKKDDQAAYSELPYNIQMDTPNPGQVTITGKLRGDMQETVIVLTNTGRDAKDGLEMLVNRADITIPGTGYAQSLNYRSREAPNGLSPAMLTDLNFDGYLDLDLTVGMGAANRFSVFALWQPEEGCFAQVMEGIELCNYTLQPERKEIWVFIHESALCHDIIRYHWENGGLVKKAVGSVYTGDLPEDVYESAKLIRDDGTEMVLWDDNYGLDWYSGNTVYNERDTVLENVIYRNALEETPQIAAVINADWVNLRKLDTKSAVSVGKIKEGDTVQVLAENCGADRGWVRVLWEGKTGYMWHSFLEMRKAQ